MHVHNNDKMRQLLIQTCALILIIGVVFAKKRTVVLMDSGSKSSGAIYTKDTIILFNCWFTLFVSFGHCVSFKILTFYVDSGQCKIEFSTVLVLATPRLLKCHNIIIECSINIIKCYSAISQVSCCHSMVLNAIASPYIEMVDTISAKLMLLVTQLKGLVLP